MKFRGKKINWAHITKVAVLLFALVAMLLTLVLPFIPY